MLFYGTIGLFYCELIVIRLKVLLMSYAIRTLGFV